MLELVGVQQLRAHYAAVGSDEVAVGVDRVAGVFALRHAAQHVLVAGSIDGKVDRIAVGIHARALRDPLLAGEV